MRLHEVHGEKQRWFDNPYWTVRTFCGLRVPVDSDHTQERLALSPTPVTCKRCKHAMRHRGRSLAEQWREDNGHFANIAPAQEAL
jgi:hypothetical protein